jgi:hypothetical protein
MVALLPVYQGAACIQLAMKHLLTLVCSASCRVLLCPCRYFLRGSLPWQGLQAATKKQKYEKISEKKMKTSFESLCKGFPQEFVTYFQYVRWEGLRRVWWLRAVQQQQQQQRWRQMLPWRASAKGCRCLQ